MPMRDRAHLDWPFFDEQHRKLAVELDAWAQRDLGDRAHDNVDAACRTLVAVLGRDGWLRWCVPAAYGGAIEQLDSRALCVIRETLAYHEGLADFAFAMQGLGSGAITLAGSAAQRQSILPRVAAGLAIMAFALSEPEAGSDVGALCCRARRDGDTWVLNGEKTWISNGGIAHYYTVFARSDATATGAKGISAFIVPADAQPRRIAERIDGSPSMIAACQPQICWVLRARASSWRWPRSTSFARQ
jgi:acyl-CoA dehydrogenase